MGAEEVARVVRLARFVEGAGALRSLERLEGIGTSR